MPTIIQNLAAVRMLLGEPNPQAPSDRILFELLGNQVLHQQTQLQNSSAPWAVSNFLLTVNSGSEDYLISATDFGKPFWCYFDNSGNPQLPRMEIPFALMQNADQFYSGPVQLNGSTDNYPLVGLMSFYRSAGSWYVRVTPVPGGSQTYVIWYEVAPTAPQSLGETPGLTPFHHLIRTQTALAALPYTAWGSVASDALESPQAAAWERKSGALLTALSAQAAQFQAQFSTYLGTLMEAGVERRQGFGDGYLDGGGPGWGSGFAPNSWGGV